VNFLFDSNSERSKKMSTEQRKWNLLTDGILWKEAATTLDDPELRKQCEVVVGWLQEDLDQTSGVDFICADSTAAAFIRKRQVIGYEVAHTRINAFRSRERVEKADPPIREATRTAAAFPPDEVLDRVIKHQSMCDRQIQKYMELLWRRAQEEPPVVSRKPAQSTQAGEVRLESTGG
jgi:hypothetical protein